MKALMIWILAMTSIAATAKDHTGEILFKVKENHFKSFGEADRLLAQYGYSQKSFTNSGIDSFRPNHKGMTIDQIKANLEDSGAFEFIEYNTFEHEIGQEVPITDPEASEQYHHEILKTQKAWSVTQGEGVVVAVCDSGVESRHEDLRDNMLLQGAWDFIDNDDEANPATSHGTFVAGLIAASANNGVGIAGMAPKAKILPLRIATTRGGTTIKTIVDCIQYAADQGAKIINVSFTGVNSEAVAEAGRYAYERGSLLIYSAGNQGNNTSWQDRPHVLAVGGSNASDGLWRVRRCRFRFFCSTSGSNAGDFVDIVTPGHNIFSTTTYIEHNAGGKRYRNGSGTSYSAPILSGIAALVASVRPDLGPLEIEDVLKETADKIGSGSEYYYGAGRANAYEAVKFALDY